MLTLEQLTTPVTEDEALTEILAILAELGLQTTSWQEGSIQRTFWQTVARLYSQLTQYVGGSTAGRFLGLSTGEFLRLLALYNYQRTKQEPTPTIGTMLLTASAAAPPHSWGANELIIANGEEDTDGAISYTVLDAGNLNPGNTLAVEVQCNTTGTEGNIAPGATLYLWTPLAGVTATNPALDLSNTWVTTPGTDEESDARLQARCLARWAHLGYSNTEGAYLGWALEALPALTRAAVRAAPGDGTVTVIGATALGGLSAGQIETIEDYINGVTDGVGRRLINDILAVESAVEKTDSPVTYTVYVTNPYSATIEADISTALLELFGDLPIGGRKLTSPTQGYVLYDEIIDTIRAVEGVRSVTLSAPTANVALDADEIFVPTITATVVVVN
jgi:uncharacterized phage protein gp47/JayE